MKTLTKEKILEVLNEMSVNVMRVPMLHSADWNKFVERIESLQEDKPRSAEDKLYQCPYTKATKCNLRDCCLECETFGEFHLQENQPKPTDEEKGEDAMFFIIDNPSEYEYVQKFVAGSTSEKEFMKDIATKHWKNQKLIADNYTIILRGRKDNA